MKPENLKFLSDQILYCGFGKELEKKLQNAMTKGKDEFSLNTKISYATFDGEKEASYKLNFKKGNDDMYFFNSYHITLNNETAKMFVNRGEKNITSKEAFNLMEGRPVYRELQTKGGEKYNAWVQIKPETLKEDNVRYQLYNDKYGFDAKAAINAINEHGFYFNFNSDNTISNLKKGNLVEIHDADRATKLLVAANPGERGLSIFNGSGEQLKLADLGKEQGIEKSEKTGISM